MSDYASDQKWSDQFIPEIINIVAKHLLRPAPLTEDMYHNTDLIVLGMDSIRIGCRIRRFEKHYKNYPFDFTIREGRPNGAKTELTKIIEGWGDYFFYGFGREDGVLGSWIFSDLRVFRRWFLREICKHNGRLPGISRKNYNGDSTFRAFDYRQLPPEFIIEKYSEVVPF